MITADQLLAHAIGDYVLQSDWMANKKRTESGAAFWHAFVYSLVFLVFAPSFVAWTAIFCTHFYIDRYGLARYVVWAKNFLAPKWTSIVTGLSDEEVARRVVCANALPPERGRAYVQAQTCRRRNLPWEYCTGTGYPPERPPFLAVGLLIAADNCIHILINGLALRYL